MMNEEWRDIKGYERYYQVSNLGRVRSLPRITHVIGISRIDGTLRNESWQRMGKVLQPIYATNGGGPYVHLHKDGEPRRTVMIKRLVAEAFIDTFDSKMKTSSIKLTDPAKGCNLDNLYLIYDTNGGKH